MGIIGAVWGFVGVVSLLGFAIFRLAPRAWEALSEPLSTVQWIFLIGFTLFMLVAEGYRGFQKKFSPRTAARVKYLRDHPHPVRVILAPLFCMGYFFAKKKTQITSICLTLGIILLVVIVRFLPNPWRGLVDTGVVLGLAYGIVTFAVFTAKALGGGEYSHSPEVPVES
ncbi:MAG: hypothetical protein CMO55_05560 [Verrucomicrobiales bacterium]|nr:hypothetical protein [Verrucomicrobiales bacterium]